MAVLGWLAVHGLPGVLTSPRGPVTGARHAAVLGSLTPPYVSGGLAAALATPRPTATPTRLVIAADVAGERPFVTCAKGAVAPKAQVTNGHSATEVTEAGETATEAGATATEVAGETETEANGPDLGWSTEQPLAASAAIDTLDTAGVVGVILDADATVAGAVRAVAADIARAADLVVATLRASGVVHYVGSGTSGRMGVLDAVELLPTYHVGSESFRAHLAGGADAMVRAAEGAEDDDAAGAALAATFGPADLVIGIAASGRTPYVRGALEGARRGGLPTVLVSANPAAPLAALADVAVLPDTGPEVVTGSTRMKAATAQKMVLNAVSTAAMVRLGKTYGNLMIAMVPTNAKLRARSVRMLAQGSGRPEEDCAAALAAAGGDVRRALVALIAGLPPGDAASAAVTEALADHPADPGRRGDPSGIRAAADAVRREGREAP
ncbi:MAG: N-acetylmuramic acid 6-phosphate etherase [Austwickia sp.]|nr:MAG: N-acetylmuramic acid 6-phosphate etherase [Austwickia sp.]